MKPQKSCRSSAKLLSIDGMRHTEHVAHRISLCDCLKDRRMAKAKLQKFIWILVELLMYLTQGEPVVPFKEKRTVAAATATILTKGCALHCYGMWV